MSSNYKLSFVFDNIFDKDNLFEGKILFLSIIYDMEVFIYNKNYENIIINKCEEFFTYFNLVNFKNIDKKFNIKLYTISESSYIEIKNDDKIFISYQIYLHSNYKNIIDKIQDVRVFFKTNNKIHNIWYPSVYFNNWNTNTNTIILNSKFFVINDIFLKNDEDINSIPEVVLEKRLHKLQKLNE